MIMLCSCELCEDTNHNEYIYVLALDYEERLAKKNAQLRTTKA